MDAPLLSSNATSEGTHQGPAIPTAAILCLALGTYVMLMLAALLIRRYFKTHMWSGGSRCTKGNNCTGCGCPDCRLCWGQFEDAIKSLCGCCGSCQKLKCEKQCGCCNSCCPSCDGISWPCCSKDPMCECGRCNCTCACHLPKCHSINCCCFEINIAS